MWAVQWQGLQPFAYYIGKRSANRLAPDMTNYQWHSDYAEVINILVTKCWREESYAEAELKK
ncbi:TPA: antitermination protein [Klebsiella michiganensis]|nr:antitermination protein [Klebsiella sp.]MDU3359098.1 antitermination protein [Klebsiella sp.]